MPKPDFNYELVVDTKKAMAELSKLKVISDAIVKNLNQATRKAEKLNARLKRAQ